MRRATTAAQAPARCAPRRVQVRSWIPHITPLLVLLVLSVPPGVAAAHWGGLDDYGCHTARKAGTYHCHVGRFAGHSFESKDAMLRQLNAGAVDGQARAVTRPPRTPR